MSLKSENTKRTSVYFSPDLYQRVQVSAEKHRRAFNQEILWLIEQGFQVEQRIDLELSSKIADYKGEITMQESEYWLPFEQAREYVRTLKLKNPAEWQSYCKSGEKPADIPSNPEKVYKSVWKGIDDWLRELRNHLDLKDLGEWGSFSESGQKPDDISLKSEDDKEQE
jgi:hypothetical protein